MGISITIPPVVSSGSGSQNLYVNVKDAPYNATGNGTTNDSAAIQAAINANPGKTLFLPDLGGGSYRLDTAITGIDTVDFWGANRITFPGTFKLPVTKGVFSANRYLAYGYGVLRKYTGTGAGWYFLFDKGELHDNMLLKSAGVPVSSTPLVISGTGNSELNLPTDWTQFGIDSSLWTPTGAQFQPDEVYARQGLVIGASVAVTGMALTASYPVNRQELVAWNGGANTNFGGLAGYTITWDAATGTMAWTRTTSSPFVKNGLGTTNLYGPYIFPKINGTNAPRIPMLTTASSTGFSLRFIDPLTNSAVLTPDSGCQLYIVDPYKQYDAVDWSLVPALVSSNIWTQIVFVRR